MRLRVAAAAGALAVLVASVAWVSAGAATGCAALQVRNGGPYSTSALYRVVLPEAGSTRLGVLDYRMNALGYAGSQGVVYGMAARSRSGPFPDGAHVVRLESSGQVRDLGPVRAGRTGTPWYPMRVPTAGTINGNRWYVVERNYLYTVDIDPGSPEFRSVLSMTAIEPWYWSFEIDDFDVDPVDGELYGVVMTYLGTAVVRIDRGSGRVTKLADAHGLPPGDHGSVVIGPDRALYVSADQAGGWYRVGRDGSAERLASVPPMWSSDAAGCLVQTPPPRRPAPTTTLPPTPTTTRPPTTPPPSPPAPSPPAPSPPVMTSPPSPPPPPPPGPGSYEPPVQPDTEDAGQDTKEKRRWALATLLLLIGGSAAARRLR